VEVALGVYKKELAAVWGYVLTRWVLELGVGILLLFILLPVGLIFLAILLIGAIMAFALAKTSIILAVLVGLILLVVAIVFVIIAMALSMPVAVYFRYYSLDVLKHIDPSAVIYSDKFSPPPPPSMLPP